MGQAFEIKYFNRYTKNNETEKVYGHKAVEFAYASMLGKMIAPLIASKFVSKLYGKKQDSRKSGEKVPNFVKEFSINLDEFEKGSLKNQSPENSYKSFNEFFIRPFKPGKRNFNEHSNILGACAEARYFGYEKTSPDISIPVKGKYLTAKDLLGNERWNGHFEGGPLVVARLCPVDYHRYHYPDSGKTIDSYNIQGDLHSVNPIALKYREDIFIKNERRVSILETENFGKLAYIEVGATCVGKIVQSYDEAKAFNKGDEKGYFLFGGSTVVLLGEPGRWKPSEDILDHTSKGLETYIQLGDHLGQK